MKRRLEEYISFDILNEKDCVRGVQSGLRTTARDIKGLQVFGENRADDLIGMQLGPLNSVEQTMIGFEGGLVSAASRAIGAQSNVVSIAYELKGAQAGPGNFAKKARGFQGGFVNVVWEEADGVVQLGGLCYIHSNPWYARLLPFVNYGGRTAKRKMKGILKAASKAEKVKKNSTSMLEALAEQPRLVYARY